MEWNWNITYYEAVTIVTATIVAITSVGAFLMRFVQPVAGALRTYDRQHLHNAVMTAAMLAVLRSLRSDGEQGSDGEIDRAYEALEQHIIELANDCNKKR
jgi:hypothetical protein